MRRDMVSSDETVAMEADAPETVSSAGVVKWERFLPTMALRVLLVESDDSTRQIIAALLRKCSYRVAAVTDGLKAWEILKGRPHNIDLILTEVDLPSISGFALLTLIQEHDVCKKIPVIMMSSKDSISTVYKCMTRGAADYLVKPVRINELKNLWQHVWRRQLSSKNTNGQQDESEAPQKVEATAENDAASNRSSGKGDNESLGKGSDAQSSCTKPDLDTDIAEVEQKQEYNAIEFLKRDDKVSTVDSAINLIGAFDNSPRRIYIDSSLKSDLQPDLGLSLRQSDPSCITNQKHQEKHSLKHSDASAFSRYMNKPLISPHSGSVNLQNQEFPRITGNQKTVQSTQAGNSEYYVKHHHQQRVFPAPILVKGIRFGDFRSQSGSSPAPLIRADSFQLSSCENNNFDCNMRDPHDQNPCNSPSNQSRQNHELLKLEERAAHISPPATDGSGSSSFCNGTTLTTGFNNIMDCGSGTGEDSSQRSIQREAALAKFRLKRKDRCFEKKVRYESRKKLAEQRPRVKGQFVRQIQTDGETNV